MKTIISGLFTLSLLSGCAGTPPDGLGPRDGKLAPCPSTPNCVSAEALDDIHRIDPFSYDVSRSEAINTLVNVLEAEPRVQIVVQESDYIRAEARTKIFRFVDDLEFSFARDDGRILIRSASRLGSGDLGVNRKRMEHIREKFARALSE